MVHIRSLYLIFTQEKLYQASKTEDDLESLIDKYQMFRLCHAHSQILGKNTRKKVKLYVLFHATHLQLALNKSHSHNIKILSHVHLRQELNLRPFSCNISDRADMERAAGRIDSDTMKQAGCNTEVRGGF